MSSKMRKLVGALALLVLIAVYAMLAVVVAAVLQMQDVNKTVELIFYAVAGLLWVVPAGWLVKWMQHEPGPRPKA